MESVIVPKLGLTMIEATVGDWLVKVGDVVNAEDPLVDIETDKIVHTIHAPCKGTVMEIFVPKGATVKVGSILCTIQPRN